MAPWEGSRGVRHLKLQTGRLSLHRFGCRAGLGGSPPRASGWAGACPGAQLLAREGSQGATGAKQRIPYPVVLLDLPLQSRLGSERAGKKHNSGQNLCSREAEKGKGSLS